MIISNPDNEVLMLQRSDNDCWCFPGGALDLGENLEETAIREVFEETGLQVSNLDIFGVFSGEELHYTYPNGDEVYIVDVVYKTNYYEGQMILDHESKSFQFFDITNLPSNISPPVKPIVNKLLKIGK